MKKIKVYIQFDNDEPEIKFETERLEKGDFQEDSPCLVVDNYSDDFTLHFRGESAIEFEGESGKKFKIFTKIESVFPNKYI